MTLDDLLTIDIVHTVLPLHFFVLYAEWVPTMWWAEPQLKEHLGDLSVWPLTERSRPLNERSWLVNERSSGVHKNSLDSRKTQLVTDKTSFNTHLQYKYTLWRVCSISECGCVLVGGLSCSSSLELRQGHSEDKHTSSCQHHGKISNILINILINVLIQYAQNAKKQ